MSERTGMMNPNRVSAEVDNSGEHVRNLSAAASFLGDSAHIEMNHPKRVMRPASRSREESDPILEYRDPRDDYDMYPRSRAYSRAGYGREPGESSGGNPRQSSDNHEHSEGKSWSTDEALANDINRLAFANGNSSGRHLVEDTRFQVQNRRPMNKFEAMSHQGEDIRKFAIGGYTIDHDMNVREALKVVSQPKAKLPPIFVNDILNHYTHFFSGISEVFTDEEQSDIANGTLDYPTDVPFVFTKLSGLMSEGYRHTDSESMTFLKNTLVTTFELETPKLSRFGTPIEDSVPQMNVKASLWGFQYIEEGMRMNEEELRMFLQQNLSIFKLMWHNELKLTKLPYFLKTGSTRASSRTYSSSSSSSRMEAIKESLSESPDSASVVSRRSRRKRSDSSKQSDRGGEGQAITKYFASRR